MSHACHTDLLSLDPPAYRASCVCGWVSDTQPSHRRAWLTAERHEFDQIPRPEPAPEPAPEPSIDHPYDDAPPLTDDDAP